MVGVTDAAPRGDFWRVDRPDAPQTRRPAFPSFADHSNITRKETITVLVVRSPGCTSLVHPQCYPLRVGLDLVRGAGREVRVIW